MKQVDRMVGQGMDVEEEENGGWLSRWKRRVGWLAKGKKWARRRIRKGWWDGTGG